GDGLHRPRRRRILEGAHGLKRVPPAKLEGDRAQACGQDSHLDRGRGYVLPEQRGSPSRGLPEDDHLASVRRIDQVRTSRAALLERAVSSGRKAEDDGRLRRRDGAARRGSPVVARVNRSFGSAVYGAGDRAARAPVALSGIEPRRSRNVCSCATTAAPSPMAAPTRFTEPQRTPPTAKMPPRPLS